MSPERVRKAWSSNEKPVGEGRAAEVSVWPESESVRKSTSEGSRGTHRDDDLADEAPYPVRLALDEVLIRDPARLPPPALDDELPHLAPRRVAPDDGAPHLGPAAAIACGPDERVGCAALVVEVVGRRLVEVEPALVRRVRGRGGRGGRGGGGEEVVDLGRELAGRSVCVPSCK